MAAPSMYSSGAADGGPLQRGRSSLGERSWLCLTFLCSLKVT